MAVAPVMAHDIEVVVVEPAAPRCLSHRPSMPVRGDDLSEPYQWQVTKQGSRLPPYCIHVSSVECIVVFRTLCITGEPCRTSAEAAPDQGLESTRLVNLPNLQPRNHPRPANRSQ